MKRLLVLQAFLLAGPPAHATEAQARITTLVLDLDDKPVEGAVVFAPDLKYSGPAPLHPAVMDQVGQELVPHLLVVQTGTKVRFPNKDNIRHHLYSFSPAKTFDLPLYKGEPADPILFDKPGAVDVGCNIHDWMSGIILVLPNPYFAKTDAEGRAVLSVPAGEKIELSVFHDRLKGSVDDTRKTIRIKKGSASASWQLSLKRPRPSKRPPMKY